MSTMEPERPRAGDHRFRRRRSLAVWLLTVAGCDGSAPAQVAQAPDGGAPFPSRHAALPASPDGLALVSDYASDRVQAISLEDGQTLASRPVGKDPVGVDGAQALVVDQHRGAAYVALRPLAHQPHGDEPHAGQPGFLQRIALADLRITGEIALAPDPSDMAISEDGRRLVVAHWYDAGLALAIEEPARLESARARLLVVDPDAIEPYLSPDPPGARVCVGATGVALSRPDGAWAYVGCYGEDAVARVDLTRQPLQVERLAIGPAAGAPGHPVYGVYDVALSPDGGTLAVAGIAAREVRFVDTAGWTLDGALPFDGAPAAVAFEPGGDLLVLTRAPGSIRRLAASDPQEIAARDLEPDGCALPMSMQLSTSSVLVACAGGEGPGRLLELDLLTLLPQRESEILAAPTSIALVAGESP